MSDKPGYNRLPREVSLPKIEDPRGNLSFVQRGVGIDFTPARVYWVYDMPGGTIRHGRALKNTSEFIIPLSGSMTVRHTSPDGLYADTFIHEADRGVLLPPMTWRQVDGFSTNAVMTVLASSRYDVRDYFYEKEEYLRADKGIVGSGDTTDEDEAMPAPTDRYLVMKVGDSHTSMLDVLPHPNGKLVSVEFGNGIDFRPRRVFYLYDVPAGESRGGHAHYQARELIVAVSGAFDVVLDDGVDKITYRLDRPDKGLYIPEGLWRELHSFSGGAVCMVVTSHLYDPDDYIRDYECFIKIKNNA